MNSNDTINVRLDSNQSSFGEINVDGFFATHIADQMLLNDESLTRDTVNGIFNNALSILNNCPNPKNEGFFSRTGIVIGKVQSGKTSNFISLLALAFDNGYNLAVVIGGNTKELLTQNVNRIKKAFNVSGDRLKVLHSKDNHNLLTPEKIRRFIENGQKVIIVTLKSPQTKNKKHMSRVSQLFDDPVMANEATIIIDDEGDQATLNSKVYSKDEDVSKHVSSTYKVALEIKNKIKRHCFVSITATPQANILIKTSDSLSPDFGQLIYPGVGYCGLSTFHGEEQDKYVKVISEEVDDFLEEGKGIPISLYEALAAFYVSNAVRKSRGDNKTHSMLIHPSVKKYDHSIVQMKVDSLLNEWRNIVRMGKNDISYVYNLKKYLYSAYTMYSVDGVIMPSFEDLENTIFDCILKSSDVLVFNSDQVNAGADAEQYTTRIYLGGAILDRGITISGLTITYIFRRAKGFQNVDNTEQRARWFGYKNVPYFNDYIDLCRVWATKSIKDDFASINESDEEMWTSIERNLKLGVPFKEIPRLFVLQHDLSHKLRLTRPNVAKTEEILSWSEWRKQDFFISDILKADSNYQLLENFRKTIPGHVIDHGGINQNFYAYDINLEYFINEIISRFKFEENDTFSFGFFDLIFRMLSKKNKIEKIDLCWVRYNEETKRTIYDDMTFAPPFFRGRDLRNNSNGTYSYLGDRSTCNGREDRIQIQIHYIKAKNRPEWDFCSPTLCIYIPKKYAIKLVRDVK